MAGKQRIRLYWVFTEDRKEDWFIFASRARQAQAYHENYEGYGKGDAEARLVIANVPLEEFENGKPPCHAQMPDLLKLGLKDAGSAPSIRRVEYQGEIFEEGILESIVVAGRKNMVLMLREKGNHMPGEATCSTAGPEGETERSAPGPLGAVPAGAGLGGPGEGSDGRPDILRAAEFA
jgi:hypothetical protein